MTFHSRIYEQLIVGLQILKMFTTSDLKKLTTEKVVTTSTMFWVETKITPLIFFTLFLWFFSKMGSDLPNDITYQISSVSFHLLHKHIPILIIEGTARQNFLMMPIITCACKS